MEYHELTLRKRLLAVLLSLAVFLSLSSFGTLAVFADNETGDNPEVANADVVEEVLEEDGADEDLMGDVEDIELVADEPLLAGEKNSSGINGGDSITENGVYTLAEGATGTITIGDGLDVTIDGGNYDTSTGAFRTPYIDLNLVVGDGTKLTIKDLYADVQEDANSIIDFTGTGTLYITGHNLLDRPNGFGSKSTIHVGPNADVIFDGDGYLWGYKHAAGSYIGSDANEVCGNVTFNGGTWMLKASKTGALIGQDSSSAATGTITINGGTIYLKAVARGSLLGASANGQAPDVTVNGGQLEIVTDWLGAAIGSANAARAGSLTVNGGSIRTIVTQNAWSNKYWDTGIDKENTKGAVLTDANITAAHDTKMLAFDASDYAGASSINVYVDGSDTPFYSGGLYEFCTNEVKNPNTPFANSTMCNWLPNTSEYALGANTEYSGEYPANNGSQLAGDNTLVFQLSKANHTLKVNDDEYKAIYDADTDSFSLVKETFITEVSSVDDLSALAASVNGGKDYAGKTVTLTSDIDLSSVDNWTPIGNSSKSFAGTFDGAGHTISGFTVTNAAGGYKALFGNNSGTIKNFTLKGQFGTSEAPATASGDCFAGAVAYNTGTVDGVINYVDMYLTGGEGYATGGVVGRCDGGTVTNCGNEGAISCDTFKNFYRTGGIVGHLNNGSVSDSYNHARIEAWNYRNGCQGTGGVVGSIDTNGTVSNCYNTGTVHNGKGDSSTGGKQGAGGIVGSINAGSVDHCYAIANVYGPGSAGIIIGKVGNGTYSNLYSLNTARAYQQYGTKTDEETGLKYADGSDENEDGSIKFSGAAIANSYNGGYTISDSYTKSEAEMKTAEFAALLGKGFAAQDGAYPVLAWEAAAAQAAENQAAADTVTDTINALPDADKVTTADKDVIEAARAAYDALTDEQKALVSEVTLKKLTDAEKALEAAEKAEAPANNDKKEETAPAADTTKVGTEAQVAAGTVKVTSTQANTVAFTKAKNKKSVSVPATVTINGKTYQVTKICANAFRGSKIRTVTVGANVDTIESGAFNKSKATKLIVKSKKLTKKKVKGSLKKSKVKTVKVKVGKKKENKKYVKKYKKIFTKKNAGKKVKVK